MSSYLIFMQFFNGAIQQMDRNFPFLPSASAATGGMGGRDHVLRVAVGP